MSVLGEVNGFSITDMVVRQTLQKLHARQMQRSENEIPTSLVAGGMAPQWTTHHTHS